MRISYKELTKKPVETVSGLQIGKVAGIVIDTNSHSIVCYDVKRGHVGNRQTVCIHPSFVVAITEEKIIIKDGYVPETVEKRKKIVAMQAKGIAQSKAN